MRSPHTQVYSTFVVSDIMMKTLIRFWLHVSPAAISILFLSIFSVGFVVVVDFVLQMPDLV